MTAETPMPGSLHPMVREILPVESGVRCRLLLLKLQLLVKKALLKLELLPQQLLLKWVRDAWSEPHANESAEDGRANSGKEKLVCHRRVLTTANDKLRHGGENQ